MADEMINNINKYIVAFSDFIISQDPWYMAGGAFLFAFLLMITGYFRTRKLIKLSNSLKIYDMLLKNIYMTGGIERNLGELLELFYPLVYSKEFAFYLLDTRNAQYVLKAVKHVVAEDGFIGPSYSGLLPYKKEVFVPPISFPSKDISMDIAVIKEGSVPILNVPIKGGVGIVRIGPIPRISRKTKGILKLLVEKMQPVLSVLIQTENMKTQVETVVASGKAMSSISNIVMDDTGMLGTIISLCARTVAASGGFFLRYEGTKPHLMSVIGMDTDTIEIFKSDEEGISSFKKILGKDNLVAVNREDRDFYSIPSYFATMGIQKFLLLRVSDDILDGLAGFWYLEGSVIDDSASHRITALSMMTRKIGDIIYNHEEFKKLSSSYIDTLRILANMMDNQNSFTVGYSELMSRYSAIIAREMKLDRSEIQDVMLAAFLSNIGVLGLSDNMFGKEGKFSELEYEMMKLHSDVGASIVESTIANRRVGAFIRHHHERVDGNGYPSGLKGNEIPLGSRIIAVVQTFLAKIGGRKGRSPLEFDKSLQLLRSASGTQLDAEAVDALIRWFKRKQESASCAGRSLGPCWEMRCSPQAICENCPAYGGTDRNCWEYKGVKCEYHGNECSSCFVHTEYLSRGKN